MLHWLCCTAQAMVLICSSWSWTYATLLHWLEQSGPLCLSIKQVCRCFPGCCLHAEMRCALEQSGGWLANATQLPWQHGFRAHAYRAACDGRQRAECEALHVPMNLEPKIVVVHWSCISGQRALSGAFDTCKQWVQVLLIFNFRQTLRPF